MGVRARPLGGERGLDVGCGTGRNTRLRGVAGAADGRVRPLRGGDRAGPRARRDRRLPRRRPRRRAARRRRLDRRPARHLRLPSASSTRTGAPGVPGRDAAGVVARAGGVVLQLAEPRRSATTAPARRSVTPVRGAARGARPGGRGRQRAVHARRAAGGVRGLR